MSGLIGKKIGMTSIFDENGKNIPCTVIEAGPCIVTQVRTEEVDGYEAVQLGFDDATEKSATKADIGHAKKAGTSAAFFQVQLVLICSDHRLIRFYTLLSIHRVWIGIGMWSERCRIHSQSLVLVL